MLAADGREVTLVGDGIAPLQALVNALAAAPTRRRLDAAGIRVVSGVRVASVERTCVVLERADGEREKISASSVVHAGRHRAIDSLVAILRTRGVAAISVGDARAPGLVEDAIRGGHDVAAALGAPSGQHDPGVQADDARFAHE